MADEVQEAQQPAATGEAAPSPAPEATTEAAPAAAQPVTLEDKLANLQTLYMELTKQFGILRFQVNELQMQAALASNQASNQASQSAKAPSMSAILRRLDRHGIRVQPEDEDEVAAGSGSERWGSAAWTEAGDGKDYPAA